MSSKIFVYLEALPVEGHSTSHYPTFTMSGGKKYVALLNNGSVYSGTGITDPDGSGVTWSKAGIPSYYANSNQAVPYPGSLCSVGGYWFTLKPAGVASPGEGTQVAYANAYDLNNVGSWTGQAVNKARSLHADTSANVAVMFKWVSTTDRNTAWISSAASDSASAPTWTQVNTNDGTLHHSVLDGFKITASAYGNGRTVVVSEKASDSPQWFARWIHVWDMGSGPDYSSDVWNLAEANVDGGTNAPQGIAKPVYSASHGKWFVGYKGGLLVSADDGATWTKTAISVASDPTVRIWDIAADQTTGTIIAVGGEEGVPTGYILRSTDGGSSWDSDPYMEGEIFTNVENVSEGVFVVAGTDGLLGFSNNDGIDWTASAGIEDAGLQGYNPNCAGLMVV